MQYSDCQNMKIAQLYFPATDLFKFFMIIKSKLVIYRNSDVGYVLYLA